MSGRTIMERREQGDRLLDRTDRAVANAARAIWRFLIDGFAAYGMAECGMLAAPRFKHVSDEVQRCSVGAGDYDDLRGDFDTIDDLIRALQTIEE